MSGGVDSSVAAGLLKQEGYEVIGAHMKCWSDGSPTSPRLRRADACASEQDAEDARRAAEVLGIPFYVFDFEKEYKEKVVEYMVDGYRQGITPNPDVMCNKEIKFGLFLKKALEMGADYVATGHYVCLVERRNFIPSTRSSATADSLVLARFADRGFAKTIGPGKAAARVSKNKASSLYGIQSSCSACVSCGNYGALKCSDFCEAKNFRARRRRGRPPEATDAGAVRNAGGAALFTAKDKNKDQSYFLWTLTQEQLRHCLFPIGDYLKPDVRKMARKFGLPNAEKKDSQGICFLGQVTLKDFLGNYLPEKRGLILNTVGKVVGEHQGAHFYTIGQRGGLGLGGQVKPVYIAEKDIKENAILVAEENDAVLYKKEIELKNVNLINSELKILNHELLIPIFVRVRYRQPLVKAKLVICRMPYATCKLVFDKPQKFVAAGQSAVFYNARGAMLGGGTIA